MELQPPHDLTLLLQRCHQGEKSARDQLLVTLYNELRRLAASYMSRERGHHTLQPTALVHEAWMRFRMEDAKNKSHFMALAAEVMKDVLVDHARKVKAAKRGGEEKALVTFNDSVGFSNGGPEEILELCSSLDRLRELDARQARLVELRVFGGLDFAEAAEVLNVSLATVKRDWILARAWLFRELQ